MDVKRTYREYTDDCVGFKRTMAKERASILEIRD